MVGRSDSFVAETNVHHPAGFNLLLDSVLCLVRDTVRFRRGRLTKKLECTHRESGRAICAKAVRCLREESISRAAWTHGHPRQAEIPRQADLLGRWRVFRAEAAYDGLKDGIRT